MYIATKQNIYPYLFILITVLCFCTPSQAQEKVRGLSVNTTLVNVKKTTDASKALSVSSTASDSLNNISASSSLIQLPFTDNFTYSLISSLQHFPDTTYWNNSIVYVNSILAVNPPAYGFASIGITGSGNSLYSYSSNDSLGYMGNDTLASNPINMNYPEKDSIYFSFSFEPRSFGYFPEYNPSLDFLYLDFYYPVSADSGVWKNVWNFTADITDTVTVFKRIMIPFTHNYKDTIDLTIFLKSGFRFRIYNFNNMQVTRAISPDSLGKWNIANVYIDTDRNIHDSKPIIISDTLPFIDDFSRFAPFPDQNKWADKDVYINNLLPLNPPTIGVATFDAFNSAGQIYSEPLNTPFQADKLTSNPINLQKYKPADSLYLSFFYESMGIVGLEGGITYPGDSLILDFFNPDPKIPDSLKWQTVWFNPGGDSSDVFKQVLIPVTNPDYFNNGFRFRFRNYSTVISNLDAGEMSNGDFWHIDYVRLDTGRNFQDTAFNDVALIYPMTSLLYNYQAIPWAQYLAGENNLLLLETYGYGKNNSISNQSIPFNVDIKDLYSGYDTVLQGTIASYSAGMFFTTPSVNISSFDISDKDSALFEIKGILQTNSNDINKWNDTAKFLQVFKNYYAYDDGTAESGYGLTGDQSVNDMVAMQFTTYAPDTITGIAVYFVPAYNNATLQYNFQYAVWKDNNGIPGQMVYKSSGNDSVHYGGFYIYPLDTTVTETLPKIKIVNSDTIKYDSIFYKVVPKPVPVAAHSNFYVGWIQEASVFLNVGIDLNTNLDSTNLFVNYQGPWQPSAWKGTLMIRPVVGHIRNNTYLSSNPALTSQNIILFPNPASDYVTINGLSDNEQVNFKVCNITGQTMLTGKLGEPATITTSNLPDGMYIVILQSGQNTYSPIKLLIQR